MIAGSTTCDRTFSILVRAFQYMPKFSIFQPNIRSIFILFDYKFSGVHTLWTNRLIGSVLISA